ncbi:MAG: carboxypeptidase-like regulatory domain-containing protein [Actinobacteria bacterium]|nr:carboxypeptidase-like regulatory domain-containing protein [Actinomycetota bacterium]
MRRLTILLVAVALTLLLCSGAAYGASPPIAAATAAPPRSMMAQLAPFSALPGLPALGFASTPAGAGVVQGHVYDSDGDPVASVELTVAAIDDQGVPIWEDSATTDATGFYSVSGAPASTQGVLVGTTGSDEWAMYHLTFADPGTSTYDVRPAMVTWSATRGGPQAASWQDPFLIWFTGTNATGGEFYVINQAPKSAAGGSGTPVTGTAMALPGDVRWMGFWFGGGMNEAAEWVATDPGNTPVPVTAGSTTPLPFTFDEAAAYRVLITRPYWASGRPGTVLRLGLQNFPAGMSFTFEGSVDSGVHTTWNGRSYTSTGPAEQTVRLTVPKEAGAGPGRVFNVGLREVTAGTPGQSYLVFGAAFQVCTLNASETAISRGTAVKLHGFVPQAGRTPKDVWIYKRTTAAAPPTVWDARQQGWTLVARLRTDRNGRYHSALLTPLRTTWYVARYAGDADYFRAYTSVRSVRVR